MRAQPSLLDRIVYYCELIWTLARKEIKVRYKNNLFGYLWSLANPLASAFVFYFAFEIIFKSSIPNFVVFLIVGLFVWQWATNFFIGSCSVYLANGNLIKKAVFPRFVLPIALDMQDAFHFLMSIPVIFVFLWSHHLSISPIMLVGILLILPGQFLFLLGVGFALASINLFFRDMERILQIALNILFYLSPVLYPVDRVPEGYRIFINLNPMTPVIESWRALFLNSTLQWSSIGRVYLLAALSLAFGIFIYRRLVSRFAEVL
ncbi:MAG: ABC transporter permease [Rhodoplanes sp.]|nr:ABC transporter permease [Rhodoplanes sp.]